MSMKNPPHPGGIVMRQCIEPKGLDVTQAAQDLGIIRQTLLDVINEREKISSEMASRLSKAFGATPEAWLGMQKAYDLWQTQDHNSEIAVEQLAVA